MRRVLTGMLIAVLWAAMAPGSAAGVTTWHELSGRVVDAGGQPLAGATITVYGYSDFFPHGPIEYVVGSTSTDTDGHYEFVYHSAAELDVVAAKLYYEPRTPWGHDSVSEDAAHLQVLDHDVVLPDAVLPGDGSTMPQLHVVSGALTVTGTLAPGGFLSANEPLLDHFAQSRTIDWRRDGAPVGDGSPHYSVTNADAGHTLTLTWTAERDWYADLVLTAGPLVVPAQPGGGPSAPPPPASSTVSLTATAHHVVRRGHAVVVRLLLDGSGVGGTASVVTADGRVLGEVALVPGVPASVRLAPMRPGRHVLAARYVADNDVATDSSPFVVRVRRR